VNLADARERELLRQFDEDRSKKIHRAIVTIDGQEYLEVALPFLETTEACHRCHGAQEAAPAGMRAMYPAEGGYSEPIGKISAIESIPAPIAGTLRIAWAASGASPSPFCPSRDSPRSVGPYAGGYASAPSRSWRRSRSGGEPSRRWSS
jgi:hypothetical protein